MIVKPKTYAACTPSRSRRPIISPFFAAHVTKVCLISAAVSFILLLDRDMLVHDMLHCTFYLLRLSPEIVRPCWQEDRMHTVASLVSTIQELMDELKISAATPLDNRILGSLAIPSSNGVPVLQNAEVWVLLFDFPRQSFPMPTGMHALLYSFLVSPLIRGQKTRCSAVILFPTHPSAMFVNSTQRTASSVGIDRAALEELSTRHEELNNQRVGAVVFVDEMRVGHAGAKVL